MALSASVANIRPFSRRAAAVLASQLPPGPPPLPLLGSASAWLPLRLAAARAAAGLPAGAPDHLLSLCLPRLVARGCACDAQPRLHGPLPEPRPQAALLGRGAWLLQRAGRALARARPGLRARRSGQHPRHQVTARQVPAICPSTATYAGSSALCGVRRQEHLHQRIPCLCH